MAPRAQRNFWLAVGMLAVLGLVLVVLTRRRPPGVPTTVPAGPGSGVASAERAGPRTALDRSVSRDGFVGSAACAPCHVEQARAHTASHHAKALVRLLPGKLEAKHSGASFSSALGGVTRFSEQAGGYEVTTPNAAGQAESFRVVYAAGVAPLQQYVVATPRGKLQSLGVVWDSRPKSSGGGRWFHVYGPRGIAPDDSLYFTSAAQNWNHVCADCHSTFVERRYDLAEDRFDTRWAELSVGCEACHGPGAEHVRGAKAGPKAAGWGEGKGFPVRLKPAAPWAASSTGSPTSRPQDGIEVDVCAPCHSRRQPLHEGFVAGEPFLDSFEPELLRPGRYHADGQVEGEVYEWASFLQSRMYASGVRCSDCHDPHSAELYAPGNALCVRCHAPARFDTQSHSGHVGSNAPLCVDCHMPPSTFMQVDERRDHSIRIPRPDLSIAFGTPNACNGCHTKKTAAWALESISKWHPEWVRRPHFVEALGRDQKGALDAPRALNALARDATAPGIARATALERLGSFPSERTLDTLRAALSSSEPLVVYGAVLGAAELPPNERARLLLPVAGHALRAVRIAVGKALAGLPLDKLDVGQRAAVERAFADVEQSFAVSASQPQTHVERSSFELALGKPEEAELALKTALRLSPCLAEAHLNLADLARGRGDEAGAEREIRAALECDPKNASAHHALGLWQVRRHDPRSALTSLQKAVELAPSDIHFAYVLAVATAEGGDLARALELVEGTLKKRPNDRALLQALADYRRRMGRTEAAAEAQRALEALLRE